MIYQQGDVLIEAADSIPQEAKLREGRCVLAEGEATGHAHLIEQKGAKLYEGSNGILSLLVPDVITRISGREHSVYKKVENDEEIVVNLRLDEVAEENGVLVTHEEHKPQVIAPGKYHIRNVREYDHFEEEARVVAD